MITLKTIFLSILVSLGQIVENPSLFQNVWKTQEENEFKIEFPDNWDINKSGQMGTSLILFSPLSSNQDRFRENVTVMIQDLKGMDINMDKYVDISIGQIKTMATDGVLLESKRMTVSQSSFHKIIYTFKQGIFMLKVEQYYYIKNQKAYIVTLTTETNQFDNYKQVGEKILNSFQLKS